MKENQSTGTICRSVFKDGASTTTSIQYTRKWIELINMLEKSKAAAPERQR